MIRWLTPQRAPFDCAQVRLHRRWSGIPAWSAKLAALLLLAVSVPVFGQDLASFETI